MVCKLRREPESLFAHGSFLGPMSLVQRKTLNVTARRPASRSRLLSGA